MSYGIMYCMFPSSLEPPHITGSSNLSKKFVQRNFTCVCFSYYMYILYVCTLAVMIHVYMCIYTYMMVRCTYVYVVSGCCSTLQEVGRESVGQMLSRLHNQHTKMQVSFWIHTYVCTCTYMYNFMHVRNFRGYLNYMDIISIIITYMYERTLLWVRNRRD